VSPSELTQLTFAAQTDAGCDPSKVVNEDAYLTCRAACGTLLAVCDGMGGHDGGRVASTTAVQVLQSLFETAPADAGSARFLRTIIETAGRAVHALATTDDEEYRPGSTCVALLCGRGAAVVAHVGDSRAYRLSRGRLERLTNDHSLVNDLVMAGVMSPQDAINHPDAHRITRALGMTAQVAVDVREIANLSPGDLFVLCSDGLTDLVTDDELVQILSMPKSNDLKSACSDLIELAKKRGGHDNISVIVARTEQLSTDTAVVREPMANDGTNTSTMALPPTVASSPIQTTMALDEPSRKVIAPTIVEPALARNPATETQPLAVHANSAPASPNPAPAGTPSQQHWVTQSLHGQPAPRSGARWVLVAAILSGLVLLGLVIWAVAR
jgi:PPM family protein phosphatase